ncbi:LysR family transcriptional regulator [Brevundimonas sp. AAP58]|uniref:LysR family transcriptional regulator n=1 Tax=Brevundimonas sp. AAP58 TaxID=1523422 RepID=UPI0006B9F30D|nr:LysR family transcriptional regulator [Brevundimonas sp. AAP58]
MDLASLDLLRLVDEERNLSLVARRMNVAVSTVSRRIDALEADLGLRLLDRRASGARLTPEGRRIAVLARPIVDQAAALRRAAEGLAVEVRERPLVISATEFVVSDLLAPALTTLFRASPKLSVVLRSQAEIVSLAHREADLAIRMSRPKGDSLIAKRLGDIALGCFAHRDYLTGRDPATLDFSAERLLIYDDSYGRMSELDWVAAAGLERAVAMRTPSTRGLLTATVAGAGIAILPALYALRAGLIAVPTPFAIPPRTAWLITHRDIRRLPAVRTAHAWVVQTFTAMLKETAALVAATAAPQP